MRRGATISSGSRIHLDPVPSSVTPSSPMQPHMNSIDAAAGAKPVAPTPRSIDLKLEVVVILVVEFP